MILEFLKAFPEQPLTFLIDSEKNIIKVHSEDGNIVLVTLMEVNFLKPLY